MISYTVCQTCGKQTSCAVYKPNDVHIAVCHACDPDTYTRVSKEQKESYLRGDRQHPLPDPLNDPSNW